MSDAPDPERLLAEALRAQAVQGALTEPAGPVPAWPGAEPTEPPEPLLPLLSGGEHEHHLLSGRIEDTLPGDRPGPAGTARFAIGAGPPAPAWGGPNRPRPRAPEPLSVWWFVLLAVLLGLAAGAVVGLVSIL